MLVRAPTDNNTPYAAVQGVAVLRDVGRRLVPRVFEATVAPAVLFYVFLNAVGIGAAILAALCWSYGAIALRLLTGRAISGLLMLSALGLGVRTLFAIVSGGTFLYFVQPVATTLVLATMFFGSVVVGRPLIGRLARDFCPMAPDVVARPKVIQLMSGLTILWACVHLVTAATTFGLLVTVPVTSYVVFKTTICLGITVAAVILTVFWSVRVAHGEDLVFATAIA
jgi:hypothetical protein